MVLATAWKELATSAKQWVLLPGLLVYYGMCYSLIGSNPSLAQRSKGMNLLRWISQCMCKSFLLTI